MTITEINQNLFIVPQGFYLAHCISGDYALGAGIAKDFDNIYDMRFKLHKKYPIPEGKKSANVGRALLIDNVFNLVTKPRYFHKPRYEDLENALIDMQAECEMQHIRKLAMPRIGCGLDRLSWERVKELIEKVFAGADIDIVICTVQAPASAVACTVISLNAQND